METINKLINIFLTLAVLIIIITIVLIFTNHHGLANQVINYAIYLVSLCVLGYIVNTTKK